MDKKQIEAMFAEAVKARVEKSTALGTKATWSMEDHLNVATKVVMKAVGIDPEDKEVYDMLRGVVQATYNHSAFAQRLEKAFEKTGHFQRDRKAPKTVDDAIAQLAASLGQG
jgi:hypothetical protein